MRAQIAYYDPPRRPAPGVRPDFTKLPLSGRSVIIADMRYRANDSATARSSREGFAARHGADHACGTSTTARR